MSYYRPTRGMLRLDEIKFDPQPLEQDLKMIEQSTQWETLGHGDRWGKIELFKNDFRHPAWDQCQAIRKVIHTFDSKVLDVCLARLGPGGWIKEHRDISGGVPMGVVRFHVPIVTHPDVEFYVSGRRQYLAPGEVWNLDTSYPHRLNNKSNVWRVHLIIDVELNDAMRTLLPKREVRDSLHDAYFWLICCWKGAQGLYRPQALVRRLSKVFQLRVMKKSSL